jgi:hypothetical protein
MVQPEIVRIGKLIYALQMFQRTFHWFVGTSCAEKTAIVVMLVHRTERFHTVTCDFEVFVNNASRPSDRSKLQQNISENEFINHRMSGL